MSDMMQLFKGLKTASEMEAFEAKNRAAIDDAPGDVRRAFNEKWKEVTGQWYYVPVTSIPKPAETKVGALHPKLADYRYSRFAKAIQWDRIVESRKAGTQYYQSTFYVVKAVLEDGNTNLIGSKISKELIARFCGKEIAEKIAKDKAASGVVEANCNVTCIGYWEVIFHPQSDEKETVNVYLSNNGLALQAPRQTPVIMPGPHLEKADNGTHPKYHEEPGVPRKIVAHIQFYPYTPTREASEAEFWAQKARGDAAEEERKRREEGR